LFGVLALVDMYICDPCNIYRVFSLGVITVDAGEVFFKRGDFMIKVIGVRFRKAGKIYYFSPRDLKLEVSDNVIVETARGVEFGTVVLGEKEIDEKTLPSPCKDIMRQATAEDIAKNEENRELEKKAAKIAQEKIQKHELPMKLIEVNYTFDRGKIIFYFSAENRVDFRELVKDLAAIFRTRIELRQIGVRDEAKFLGGYSSCGRELCCHSVLGDFHPVSIKMAKQQNLSLNPAKISGVCGRLMCCLKYEYEEYEKANKGEKGQKENSCPGCEKNCSLPHLTGEEVSEDELRALED
jgi:cell fate regulator YaaT (PSP1 superfamily)